MTRRTRPIRTTIAAVALTGTVMLLGACGGRTDGGTPIPSGSDGDATTTTEAPLPGS